MWPVTAHDGTCDWTGATRRWSQLLLAHISWEQTKRISLSVSSTRKLPQTVKMLFIKSFFDKDALIIFSISILWLWHRNNTLVQIQALIGSVSTEETAGNEWLLWVHWDQIGESLIQTGISLSSLRKGTQTAGGETILVSSTLVKVEIRRCTSVGFVCAAAVFTVSVLCHHLLIVRQETLVCVCV